jgi:hypothetical protein
MQLSRLTDHVRFQYRQATCASIYVAVLRRENDPYEQPTLDLNENLILREIESSENRQRM